MNGNSNESLSPIKLALAKIRELQDDLARFTEPIAIVGMGFRLPGGAVDPESFWRILCSGKDTAIPIPKERWDHDDFYSADPNQPSKIYVKEAAFIDDFDRFDAGFFGIGPREAEWMDPQQRLLLEVGWETLERACWKSDSIDRQHKTGVFVGTMWSEYCNERIFRLQDLSPYIGTGSGGSFLSGRISYHLGLCGPSQALDTACSSSLVAVHLACESIRRGECTRALAGGVSLMLLPETLVQICKMRALSADGRCKTFDASADGYGRGEGCGLVALRRLSDAVLDGDPILALIHGSAYNHNGANSGLTAPDAQAQRAVVEQAIRNSSIQPNQISYVEAHGTGTSLGDPIELRALWSVLRQGRDDNSVPLMVSSVKTVIGHLESAAGIAGLIKVLISLQKESIPPHLHLRNLNPIVAAENLPIDIPLERKAWPRTSHNGGRYAGISSFGMSGVNCHMIVGEHIQQAAIPIGSAAHQPSDATQNMLAAHSPAEIVYMSARSSEALRDLARKYVEAMDSDDSLRLADLAHTTAKGRLHFDHRAAIVSHSLNEARERCLRLSQGLSDRYVQIGIVCNRSKLTWMIDESFDSFSQLSQAALDLNAEYVVFSTCLRRCHQHLKACANFSLLDYLALPNDTSTSQIASSPATYQTGHLTSHEQWIVAQFAMAVALGQQWYSWRITPDAIFCQGKLRFAAAVLAAWITPEEGIELTIQWLREELSDRSPPASVLHKSVSASESPAHQTDYMPSTPAAIGLVRWETGMTMNGQTPWSTGLWADFVMTPTDSNHTVVREHIDELNKINCGLLMDLIFPSCTSSQIFRHWPNAQAPIALSCLNSTESMSATARLKVMLAKFYTHGFLPNTEPSQVSLDRRKICLPTYPFQRSRYWVPVSNYSETKDVESHPLLGCAIRLANTSDVRFEKRVTKRSPACLSDHQVFGTIVFPGAGFAEMMLKSIGDGFDICNIQIETPLGVSQPVYLQTVVRSQAELESPVIEIFSRAENSDLWTRHASCQSRPKDISSHTNEDLHQLQASCTHVHDVKEHYRRLSESGLAYGPAFQTIGELRSSTQGILARLAVQAAAVSESWIIPPEILDGAFQSLAAISENQGSDVFVPIGIERIVTHGAFGGSAWSYARWRPAGNANQREADLYLFDDKGSPLAQIEGLKLRRASRQAMRQMLQRTETQLLYSLQWQPLESTSYTPDATALKSNWFVIGSDTPVSLLQQALAMRDIHALRVSTSQQLLQMMQDRPSSPCEVVWLANVASEQESVSSLSRLAAEENTRSQLLRLLVLVQAILPVCSQLNCRLTVVTQSAVSPHGLQPVDATHSSIWGFVRALQSEHPELRTRLLDVDNFDHEATFGVDILLSEIADNQFAIGESTCYVPRLARQDLRKALPAGDYQLSIRARGSLDGMACIPIAVELPGPGYVQVAVGAAAINFRDVLNQLGAYPGDPGPLGLEMAGEIVALGEGVEGFSVGERVFGFGIGVFATRINTPAKLLARQPVGMNDVESSTIPSAFCTAYISYQLAQLSAGQRVLIHSASGGLGLAAIQLAIEAGAVVYATASQPKQAYLRSLGVEHIYDSRSTAFSEQILRDTDGQGVDVVLNSLTGEGFIESSLRALKNGGTWIELAKRNIWSDSQMREHRPDVKYRLVALDEIVLYQFDKAHEMLSAVVQKFQQGAIKPLRHKVFSVSDAAVAFRYMQHARHIGKLVLRISHGVRIRGDASYLVTGGLGALGLRTARWLAEQGAGRLVLCSLSEPSESASNEMESIASNFNCIVETVQANLSSRAEVERLTTWLRSHQYALRGIIHAAGALGDGVIKEQNAERFEKVLGVKAYGAWFLHEPCSDLPLDFFVTYSSIAAVMGSAGQSNYCAANAFLDGLASYRQSQGLAGISINWGPWADGGMANNDTVRARSEQYGISYLEPGAALDALGHALTTGLTQSVIVDADWQTFGNMLKGRRPPIFERVLASVTSLKVNEVLHEQLQTASDANRSDLLKAFLSQEIQQVLALSQKPAEDVGFFDLGMDSLMAIELGNRLRSQLGDIHLPQTLALEYPTVNKLTKYLLSEIQSLWARQRATGQTAQDSRAAELDEESASLAAAHAKVATMTESKIDFMLAQLTENPVGDLDEQYETR